MRVSMHPGQYTVLNSYRDDVVSRAIADLNYHNLVLDSLGVDIKNKIILHIGGVYGNKEEAIERFIQNYGLLNKGVKERLVIENDDKSYNIKDVLSIGNRLDIPIVYDNLHNHVLPYDKLKDDNYWINKCKNTWKREDGPQKIHYSQQDKNKRPGAHSETIEVKEFAVFLNNLDNYEDIDIMLEVKDKNLSAIKCINMQQEREILKNTISDSPILSLVLTDSDGFNFVEERRLSYVALTRTKITAYLPIP